MVTGQSYMVRILPHSQFLLQQLIHTLREKKYVTEYAPEDKHFFPRMWDNSNDQGHADYYASYAGIGKDQKTGAYTDKPTMGDNIGFFISCLLYTSPSPR